jgi:hypothetical protein
MALFFAAGGQSLEAEGFGVHVSDQEFGKVDFEECVLHRLEARAGAS